MPEPTRYEEETADSNASTRKPATPASSPPSWRERRRPAFALVLPVLFALLLLSSGSSWAEHPGTNPSSPLPSTAAPVAPAAVGPASPGASCSVTSSGVAVPAASSTPAAPVTPDFPVPSTVLYNSQVQPYAVWTGPYAYVAAGAALRDQGYGKIDLTWPSDDPLVSAYLIWSILSNTTPPSYATINGVNVSGTWTAYAEPSPCWAPTYIFTFVADVSSAVVNGVNDLTQFPSTNTSGINPWQNTLNETGLLDDGASLVAIYDTGGSALHQVTVYTGARTDEGGYIGADLNYSQASAAAATTTFIVADGQVSGNAAIWNGTRDGTVIAADAFPGSDPKETTDKWTEGNLSDTKTYPVTVPVGSTNITASTAALGGDCFTWTGQVLDVQVKPSPGPYSVTFEEQGFAPGLKWNLTTDATTQNTTATDTGSSVTFSLPNGSYSYVVTGAPGYSGPFRGNFAVDGGPLFLRLAFHQIVFTITFTETGLALGTTWWVDLTNATQPYAENLSAFAPNAVVDTVPNGTYSSYAAEDGILLVRPAHSTVTVDGADRNVIEAFVLPPLYNITFREQGLFGGTFWGGRVAYQLGALSFTGRSPTEVLQLPNVSAHRDYLFPEQPEGYSVNDEITFGVFGANRTVLVNYTPVYTVSLVASGLPKGTYWEASLSGPGVNTALGTDGRYLNFTVANGSYTFTVDPVWGYLADPTTGPADVAGANTSTAIAFTPAPTFPLSFTETGLSAGASWSVRLYFPNGTNTVFPATGKSVDLLEPNGTYSYEVLAPTGWIATPSDGDVTVAGHSVSQAIVFSQVFRIRLTEVGLVTGTYWELSFNDGFTETENPSIVYWEPNGSYSFDVYTIGGFVPTPASGTLDVNDAGVDQTIHFASATEPVYNVTFAETGLPGGTNWTAELGGFDLSSVTTKINFTEYNNTWYYYIDTVDDLYVPTPSEGPITVDGAAVTVPVAFAVAATDYTVTFTETGLPSGTTWWANVTEGAATSSSTGSVAVSLADGSYDYTIGSDNRRYDAAPGAFTVDGAAVSVPVRFSLVSYGVTFTETGLGSGVKWWVNGTGDLAVSTSSASVVAQLPNGSYSYHVDTSNKVYAAPPGTFTVVGAAVPVSVVFHEVLYAVTFTESGLPAEAAWWLNVSGVAPNKPSGDSVTLDFTNGSYSYTTGTNLSGWAKPSGGFKVDGAAASVSIVFSASKGSAPRAFLGLPGDDGYYVLGGAVGLMSLFAIILFLAAERRRRKKAQPANAATGTGGATGTGEATGASPPPPPPK